MNTAALRHLKDRCRGISVGGFEPPAETLFERIRSVALWDARLVHFDIMDGQFVSKMAGGPHLVAAAGNLLLRDVHLMVADPTEQIAAYAHAGADVISVHAEAKDAAKAIREIRRAATELSRPILAGLAIMPGTSADEIEPHLLMQPDLLLQLAVDPRSGNPADLEVAGHRLNELRRRTADFRPLLATDGGITSETIAMAAASGPDIIVSGSAIHGAADPEAAFRYFSDVWASSARIKNHV